MLGLDLGTKCGWALIRGKKLVSHGCWALTARKADHGVGARYLRLQAQLENIMGLFPDIHLIGFEDVLPRTHISVGACRLYNGLLATLHIFNESACRELVGVNPTTLKKVATGSGRASKDDVWEAAQETWQTTIETYDEADALWVAYHAGCLAKLWK